MYEVLSAANTCVVIGRDLGLFVKQFMGYVAVWLIKQLCVCPLWAIEV